jgi:hypothetical protein
MAALEEAAKGKVLAVTVIDLDYNYSHGSGRHGDFYPVRASVEINNTGATLGIWSNRKDAQRPTLSLYLVDADWRAIIAALERGMAEGEVRDAMAQPEG